MLLIGSKALNCFGIQSPYSKRTGDWDFICSKEEFDEIKKEKFKIQIIDKNKYAVFDNGIFEYEIADNNTAQSLLDILEKNPNLTKEVGGCLVASPEVCLTIKKSHRFLRNSPFFLKTMVDYKHLQNLGYNVPEVLIPWLKEREKETYNYKHPKLMGTKKADFFKDDNIQYKYDHDTLHLAVKHLDQPAYNYFKPDVAEVECSKEMFDSQPEEIKLYSVVEESYVLALERSQIPFDFKNKPRDSFLMALMKVCSSITSGWWREYAYDNYFKAVNMYSDEYVDKFKQGLKNGVVKEFTKPIY